MLTIANSLGVTGLAMGLLLGYLIARTAREPRRAGALAARMWMGALAAGLVLIAGGLVVLHPASPLDMLAGLVLLWVALTNGVAGFVGIRLATR